MGVLPNGAAAKPSPAFERVLQSAEIHARELNHAVVTGANVLMAIFPKRAVRRHACSVNMASRASA